MSHQKTSARRQGVRLTAKQRKIAQDMFLQAFSVTGNLRASCLRAGIDRNSVYAWTEMDEDFGFRLKQAELDSADHIRAEIWRRAVQGVDEVVVSGGHLVYEYEPVLDEDGNQKLDAKGKPVMRRGKPLTVKKYSDSLLALLAKARMPEFREKTSVDLNANINANITKHALTIDTKQLSRLTDDELAEMKRLAERLKAEEDEHE